MTDLTRKRCSQYEPGTQSLNEDERNALGRDVPEWKVIEGKKLRREYTFKTYMDGVAWVQLAGAISDGEDHHPDIHIFYKRVVLDLWTHTVHGLSENDYILAAKLDQSYTSFPGKR